MNGIEFNKENFMFGFKSFDEIRKYAREDLDVINVNSLKKSSYVSKIEAIDDNKILIKPNKSKKIACGVSHKILTDLKKANPNFEIRLDEDLLNMDEDNDLIFKSKNPLWVLKNVGSNLVLSRVF